MVGDVDHNEEDVEAPNISHSEGKQALEKALAYVEQQADETPSNVLLLRRWRDCAARHRSLSLRLIRF